MLYGPITQAEIDRRELGVIGDDEAFDLVEAARDHALADTDSFADWLAGKCIGKTAGNLGAVPGTHSRQEVVDLFADRLPGMREADLLHLGITSLRWGALAMQELRDRYLAWRGLQ